MLDALLLYIFLSNALHVLEVVKLLGRKLLERVNCYLLPFWLCSSREMLLSLVLRFDWGAHLKDGILLVGAGSSFTNFSFVSQFLLGLDILLFLN